MIEKLKRQIELVLKGEASLLEAAHIHHVNVDMIEQRIKSLLEMRIIFGSGDPLNDLMMASYMHGRSSQFLASMADLFGKEEFESAYNQVCLQLGIHAKRLN